MDDFPMVYAWKNNPVRAALYGRRCRVLCSGRMYSSLVEFENGEQVITSRRAVRQPGKTLGIMVPAGEGADDGA